MSAGSAAGSAPALYRFLSAVLPVLLRPLLTVRVTGAARVPRDGPCVLASNHLSALDPVVLSMSVERPIIFVAKVDFLRGWQRFFFSQVGVVGVDRRGGELAEAALRAGEQVLAEGRILGIYPEGTRSPDGRLHRGKTGPVRLALRSGAPLVPVALIGTDRILPPGVWLPRRRGRVVLKFGPPLELDAYADRDGGWAIRPATDALMATIGELSGQPYVDEYAVKARGWGARRSA